MKHFMLFVLMGLSIISLLLTSCAGGGPSEVQAEMRAQSKTTETTNSEQPLLTQESTVTLPMFAQMLDISDFEILSQFLPTLQKAEEEALNDKITGISDDDIIELKATPTTRATIPFSLSDSVIYLGTTPVFVPSFWKRWVTETYVCVVGSIQFLGEGEQFTAASLSWGNGTSYVPLFYVLQIKSHDSEFFKFKATGRYRGPSTTEELALFYQKFFPDFSSSEWMGLVVVYAVFERESLVDSFALGIAYTSLDTKYPLKHVYFVPRLELR